MALSLVHHALLYARSLHKTLFALRLKLELADQRILEEKKVGFKQPKISHFSTSSINAGTLT